MKPASVKVDDQGDGYHCVGPVFDGVDRPYTGGIHVPTKYLARTVEAFRSGAATPNARVVKDMSGATYVAYDMVLFGRYLPSSLKKIGH